MGECCQTICSECLMNNISCLEEVEFGEDSQIMNLIVHAMFMVFRELQKKRSIISFMKRLIILMISISIYRQFIESPCMDYQMNQQLDQKIDQGTVP